MPSSAVRVLELKLQIDTRQFDSGMERAVQALRVLKGEIGNLGSANIRVSGSMGQTRRAIDTVGTAARKAGKDMRGFTMETGGGIRVFGSGGSFLKALALVRNHLLLLAFAFGGVAVAMKNAISASISLENSLVGLASVARNTGNDIDKTKQAAMGLASSGLLTVSEAAAGLKNLMATGLSIDKATELMNAFTDSAAFNRQGTLALGEAVVGATQGYKNQLCITGESYLYVVSNDDGSKNSLTNNIKFRKLKIKEIYDWKLFPDVISYDKESGDFSVRKVYGIAKNGCRETIRITFEDGSYEETTPNHRFFDKNGEYIFTKDIKEGDCLLCLNQESVRTVGKNLTQGITKQDFVLSSVVQNTDTEMQANLCNAKYVVKSKKYQDQSQKQRDSVQRNVEQSGYNETCPVRTTPLINMENPNGVIGITRTVGERKNGKEKSLKRSHIDVLSVGQQQIWNSIILNLSSCIQNIDGTQITEQSYARPVINKQMKKSGLTLQKKNSQNELLVLQEQSIEEKSSIPTTGLSELSEKNLKNYELNWDTNQHPQRSKKKDPLCTNPSVNGSGECQQYIQEWVGSSFEELEKILPISLLIDSLMNLKEMGFAPDDAVSVIYEIIQIVQDGGSIYDSQVTDETENTDGVKYKKLSNKILNKLGWNQYVRSDTERDDSYGISVGGSVTTKRVVSVEYLGYQDVYDIEVCVDHNFVTGNFIISSNSMLLDNAGITRNLSNMQEEYAKSIGTTIGRLSEAQKYEGQRLGVLKDASLFTGNAELLTTKYSGAVSKLNVNLFNLKAAFGDAVIPLLGDLLSAMNPVIESWTKYLNANKELISLKVEDTFKQISDAASDLGLIIKVITDFFNNPFIKALINIQNQVRSGFFAAIKEGVGYLETFYNWLVKIDNVATKWLSQKLGINLSTLTPQMNEREQDAAAIAKRRTGIQSEESVLKNLEARKKYLDALDKQNKLTNEQEQALIGVNKQVEQANKNLEIQRGLLKQDETRYFITTLQEEAKVFGNLEQIIGRDLNTTIREFYSLSDTGKFKLVDDLRALYATAKTEVQPIVQKLINHFAQELPVAMKKTGDATKDTEDKLKEARDRWSELVDIIRSKTEEFYALDLGGAKARATAETQVLRWREVAEKAKLTVEQMKLAEDLFSKYVEGAVFEENAKRLRESVKATNILLKEAIDFTNKLQESITKQKIQQRESAVSTLEDLATRAYEGKIEGMDKGLLGLGSMQKTIAELGYAKGELEQIRQTLFDMEEQGSLTFNELVHGLELVGQVSEQQTQKAIQELSRSLQQIMNMVSAQVQVIANAYWTERDEIKRARDAELNDLMTQYNNQIIGAEEYAARRNQIMKNADIQMGNATKEAWKQVTGTVFNMMTQMLSTYVANVVAAKMAAGTMSLGAGLALTGGAGIVLGLVAAAGAYAASKSFAETPTQDYQDIYPSGGTTAEERKRYGSLSAAPVQYINITPTVSFENVGGGQIFIGSGSVSEFSDEVSQVIKETVNAAIAGNEIMLDGISPR